MDDQIVAIDCLCDDVLKALHHYEDPHCQMSDAEVMTTAVVAALHFYGWERARDWLGKSRFNCRLHAVGELFLSVFQVLGELFKQLNTQSALCHRQLPHRRLRQHLHPAGVALSK